MTVTSASGPASARTAGTVSLLTEEWRSAFQIQVEAVDQLLACGDVEALHRMMHDAKGLAPTLGYGLVAEIAARVIERLHGEKGSLDTTDTSFIMAAKAACLFVLSRNIRNDGGEAGRVILAKLDRLAVGE